MAEVDYVDSASGQRVHLEISVLAVGPGTSLAGSARVGLEGTTALLWDREEEKRNHGAIQKLLNKSGNKTIEPELELALPQMAQNPVLRG